MNGETAAELASLDALTRTQRAEQLMDEARDDLAALGTIRAQAVAQLRDTYRWSIEEIGFALGNVSRQTVHRLIREGRGEGPSTDIEAARRLPCQVCGAEEGQRCKNPDGIYIEGVHTPRIQAVQQAPTDERMRRLTHPDRI